MDPTGLSVGVDLGATKTMAALFDPKMKCLAHVKRRTPSDQGGDEVLECIAGLYGELLAEAGLPPGTKLPLGVAVPAPFDAEGTIIKAPNMGLESYPLGRRLKERLGVKARLENDVRSGTWGEFKLGALRGYEDAIGIFVGTGIGGGILLGGKLRRGANGHAGEIGHILLLDGGPVCGCGQAGCMEALASRTAMAKDAVSAAVSGKSPFLRDGPGADFRKYKSSVFEEGLRRGDPEVKRIIDRSAYWVGAGMASLVNVLDPQAIVLGGGIMARIGDYYRKRAVEAMEARLMPGFDRGVKVMVSELGDLAVPSGAALLASAGAED